MFKRKYPRPFLKRLGDLLWPKGGWGRAASYVGYRLQRLPDTPERIARGIFAGVFASFTPLYGLHFITALLIARLVRGNYLASLLGTFFGNPLTYFPIGLVSLKTGYFLLGSAPDKQVERSLLQTFVAAARDLRDNLAALVTDVDADWSNLIAFYDRVFFPYLIGGILPGLVAGGICYYLSVPLIAAYQKRRRSQLLAKNAELRRNAGEEATRPKAGPEAPSDNQ